jgi:hypothetical protein
VAGVETGFLPVPACALLKPRPDPSHVPEQIAVMQVRLRNENHWMCESCQSILFAMTETALYCPKCDKDQPTTSPKNT